MKWRTLVLLFSSRSLAGCSRAGDLAPGFNASPPGLGSVSQPAGEGLVNLATSSGALWPITAASALFLLAAIPAFFILSRKQFFCLLIVGILLAISPVVLLRILDHLVIPAAIMVGLAGLAALVFFIGRLWDRRFIKKRAEKAVEVLVSEDTPHRITDKKAAEIVGRLTDRVHSTENA